MQKSLLLLLALISFQSSAIAQYAKWVVEPLYDVIEEYNGSIAAVKRDAKWGFINQDGEEIISCKYDTITPFVDGVSIAIAPGNKLQAIIHNDGVVIDQFRNPDGGEIDLAIDPRYPYFGSDLLLVTNKTIGLIKRVVYTKWGYINKNGTLQIPISHYCAMPFCEGKAAVANSKMRFSYIDTNGNIAIPNKSDIGRAVGAFGFYNDKAVISYKDEFAVIDTEGNRIEKISYAEPEEPYYAIQSSSINCNLSQRAIIDSLGRITKFVMHSGFVRASLVEETPEPTPIQGDTHFIFEGQSCKDSVEWLTPSLALLRYKDKLGVIKVQETPVVKLEFTENNVHSIFGNVKPIGFAISNDTGADIDELVITYNDTISDVTSITTDGLNSSFLVEKTTDSEAELVKKQISVTQRGVLLLDQTVDIILMDKPGVKIIGRSDFVYYKESNTASLSVDIENTSEYPLNDAILTINNYQTKINLEPYTTINHPAFFGVNPSEEKIEVLISVKHEKSQAVTKEGSMMIKDL